MATVVWQAKLSLFDVDDGITSVFLDSRNEAGRKAR
jgi:hypothetical protein